jgi:hypothetical protein
MPELLPQFCGNVPIPAKISTNGYWPLTTGIGGVGGSSWSILWHNYTNYSGVAQLSDKIYTKHRADFQLEEISLFYLRKDGSGSYYFYGNTDVSSGWAVVGILRNMNVHFLQDGLDVSSWKMYYTQTRIITPIILPSKAATCYRPSWRYSDKQ